MKIVVLAGGISTERDVSFSSGMQIYKALKKNGHQAILLDVFLGYTGDVSADPLVGYENRAGYKASDEEIEELFSQDIDWAAQISAVTEESPDLEKVKALRPGWERNFFGPNVLKICQSGDVVFMALHGENGEDGKIQACFELLGIRYTGTNYVGSSLAMDKSLAKELFAYHRIPTPMGIHLYKGETSPKVPYPCVVKACCGGSSVGVVMAKDDAEYEKALQEAFRYDSQVIVEQFIEGREFSIGVLKGKALPVIEIAPIEGFYDYKNKYQAGSAIETCPADLPQDVAKAMQLCAEKVFQVLRLKNYARMDFMLDKQNQFFCLEANTLPGMTPTSLLPQEAAAVGMDFGMLCEKIIEAAFENE